MEGVVVSEAVFQIDGDVEWNYGSIRLIWVQELDVLKDGWLFHLSYDVLTALVHNKILKV